MTPPAVPRPCFPDHCMRMQHSNWPAMGNNPEACVAGGGPQAAQDACEALAAALPCMSAGPSPDVLSAAAGP
jgi:hypothetical protein